MPKIVEKHFFWWVEQIILPKNIFLAQFKIVQNFHYFCKVLPPSFRWVEQIILPKNIFLAQFKIVQNFHYFCKVRACWFRSKIQFSKKLSKIVEKHFFWWVEQIILPKNIFLAQFKIVQNFHYFCKVRGCRISVPKIVEKNSIFKK